MVPPQPGSVAPALVGITLSSVFVGANLALSYLAVPSLLLPASSKTATTSPSKPAISSPQLARQWRSIYNAALPAAVTGSAISSACFIYVALQAPTSYSTQRTLFFAAGSMAVLVVPYTLTLMTTTNSLLMERAKAADATKDFSEGDVTEAGMPKGQGLRGYRTDELVNRWATLNYGRATISAIGILCAIAGLLQ